MWVSNSSISYDIPFSHYMNNMVAKYYRCLGNNTGGKHNKAG